MSPDSMQPVLDKFPDSRVISIYLDSPKSLLPSSYEIITISDVDSVVSGVFNMITTESHIVFAGIDGKAIHLLDPESGVVIKTLRTLGKGPGEFEHIGSLAFDGKHIIALDMASQKIIRFTTLLTFVDEQVVSGLHVFSNIAYSSENIVYGTRSDTENLYQIKKLGSSYDPISFHRYIIDHGYQPRVYNNHFMSVNRTNVSLLNTNLPLLFSYNLDDLNIQPTILRFVGEEMERKNSDDSTALSSGGFNLPPVEIPMDRYSSVGARPLFGGVVLSGEKILVKQNSPSTLIYIHQKDSRFDYIGRFVLIDENGESLNWSSMSIQPPWVYLGRSSQNQLIRFNVEVLEEP